MGSATWEVHGLRFPKCLQQCDGGTGVVLRVHAPWASCLTWLPMVRYAGPFALNGCPVRRVNQVYVIVTSTKVDVSSVNTSKFTDAYFAKDASAKKKKSGDDFTEQEETAKEVPAERKADQAACDGKIGGLDADMSLYLKSRFSLSKGQYPHLMKF